MSLALINFVASPLLGLAFVHQTPPKNTIEETVLCPSTKKPAKKQVLASPTHTRVYVVRTYDRYAFTMFEVNQFPHLPNRTNVSQQKASN